MKARWTITTDYPDFFPVQRYAKRENVRRELYMLYLNRGFPANEKNLLELLKLRKAYANTLGYKNWADYDAAEKMAKTSQRIETFIGDLQAIVGPRNESDVKVLLARKKKDDPSAERLQVWDRFYYVDRVRSEDYAFDAQQVRPYFEYGQVTQGLMDLYGQLFGGSLRGRPRRGPSGIRRSPPTSSIQTVASSAASTSTCTRDPASTATRPCSPFRPAPRTVNWPSRRWFATSRTRASTRRP